MITVEAAAKTIKSQHKTVLAFKAETKAEADAGLSPFGQPQRWCPLSSRIRKEKRMKYDYQCLCHEISSAEYDLCALAREVDHSERSFKRKLCEGGSFTQNQICRIVEALNLPVTKIQACFFTLNS